MTVLFYLAAAVAVLATLRVITCRRPVHALLYFVASLFAVALIFFLLGARFVAALEVIVYAGAIMVLFVFAVMLLGAGDDEMLPESAGGRLRLLAGPCLLSAVLLGELAWLLFSAPAAGPGISGVVGPKEVAATLLGPYLLGVEMASMLLLAGLVAAFRLAERKETTS